MSIEGHRRLVQVIPDPVQEWWDKWELRGLILLSLVSQIILTLLGNRTKYKPNILTRALLWSAYLLADWVAAVAMGVISSNLGDYYNKGEYSKNVNPQLLTFWAPFFLMHLGGPDTITAYALEDNELWKRHLVGLLSQTTLTVYIIILSWKDNWLSHLTIPMLIIGTIKYGEKTWSLYCASMENLRDSSLRSINTSRKSKEPHEPGSCQFLNYITACYELLISERGDLWRRHRTLPSLQPINIFVSLFDNLVLRPSDITDDRSEFLYDAWKKDAFYLVDYELKMMYDVFYTKALANHSILGLMSRMITLTTTIVVLVSYANSSEKKEHLVLDHIITYLLLVEALIAEIYAFVLVAFSAWTIQDFASKGLVVFCCIPIILLELMARKKELSLVVGQSNFFNLICNKNLNKKGNLFQVNKLEELPSVSHCLITEDLQIIILEHLQNKSEEGLQSNPLGAPGYRNLLFVKKVPIFSSELEFHRTIITWHIATELFYHFDSKPSDYSGTRKNCKEMSDYMFYLLVKQRHMLPVGAGLITLNDTVIESMKFFKHIEVVPQQDNLAETCRILLQDDTARARDDEASKMQSISVLFHACAVAKELIAGENRHLTWKFVEELWIEIMMYAGAQCRVDMHAQQLRRGPEFLSCVWLFQAHLGLLDQFQFVGSISDNTPSASV